MLYSMTGYGCAESTIGDYQCMVELKALNGKQLDTYTKIPQSLKSLEISFRNKIKEALYRGSIELSITLKQNGTNKPIFINRELIEYYLKNIDEISSEYQIQKEQILPTLLRMPEIVSMGQEQFSTEDEMDLLILIDHVAEQLNAQRLIEGNMLFKLLEEKVKNIEILAAQVDQFDAQRSDDKKEKLKKLLEENMKDVQLDTNRLEQEIIYYIEKLDIAEEKARLTHHCEYFKEILIKEEALKGKKLGFIAQEIGREINTMGAKANHAEIQKIVVQMKDELEQIKEQVANVL